jgi:nitrous oxide reductase accessory protein NosL
MKYIYRIMYCFVVIICLSPSLYASGFIKPAERDKCPVCGMFVHKYPHWTAEIVFKDGTYVVFDGPKDMFKYYFNIKKYNTNRQKDDVESIYVTDYYTTRPVNARDVYFVTGSDVLGPMGKELVPVKGEDAAGTFMKDHNGKRMLRFDEVTTDDLPMMQMRGM